MTQTRPADQTTPPPDPDAATEQWLDDVDPAALQFRDAGHIRAIIAAKDNRDLADQQLHEAVAAARAAGDSWVVIGAALGVSKQAAQERFGKRRTAGQR